jgi:5'-nucleotidase (lipoprotein e(P4) family)
MRPIRRLSPARERLYGMLACVSVCAVLQGCVSVAVEEKTDPAARIERPELAVRWVTESAEYRALTRQVFRNAEAVLEELIADPDWSALPDRPADPSLPPAVILDVDETVLDNSPFQVLLGDTPFNRRDWDRWVARSDAEAVPGAVEFLARVRAAGVRVFLVTNRDCMRRPESDEACPQEGDTLENLRRIGVPADAEHLLLSGERPEWTDEKMIRRRFVAREHRVIMVFGDDLGDFIDCPRGRVIPPCERPATAADRLRAVRKYADYWGRGWFVLPNPMYGSWTSVR